MQSTMTTPHASEETKSSMPFVIVFYLALMAVLVLIAGASTYFKIPLTSFVEDTTTVLNAPVYIGILSNIGALLWTATATVCFFGAYVTRTTAKQAASAFLIWSGMIITLLLIDDYFMLHDSVLYLLFHLNENVIFGLYFVLISWYIYRFRSVLRTTNYRLFGLALGLFLFSTVFDKLPGVVTKLHIPFRYSYQTIDFIEESGKFLAIGTWLAYYLQTSIACIRRAV